MRVQPTARLAAPALIALCLLAGCATTVQKGTPDVAPATGSATAGVGSALPDQPVKIPAAARRRLVLTMTGPANVTLHTVEPEPPH